MPKYGVAVAAVLIWTAITVPAWAQPIALKLTQPQPQLPANLANLLQRELERVGCSDWTPANAGKWTKTASTQFSAFLDRTGQSIIYYQMGEPSFAEIKAQLFDDWAAQKNFIKTLRSDTKYCEPSAQTVKLRVDLRENQLLQKNTTLPNGLPTAIAKDLQRHMIEVGCPDWQGDDGLWGPSSSSQFTVFLKKTDNAEDYEPESTVAEIKDFFKPWRAQDNFIPTLNADVNYCYPLKRGGEDADSRIKVLVDLRTPQPKLDVYLTQTLHTLLKSVGCPDWSKEENRWLASAARQFTAFLRTTDQYHKYEAMKPPSVRDIKRLFNGWIPRPDFKPGLNSNPLYCYPIPRCDLNVEVRRILNDAGENVPVRDFFLRLSDLNKDLPRQSSVPGSVFSQQTAADLATVKERLSGAESGLRTLFRRVVEARNPDTCGLCNQKVNYEIALLADIPDVTQLAIEHHQAIWRDVEVLKRSITAKRELRRLKEAEKAGSGADLGAFIDRENVYLESFLVPIRREIAEEVRATPKGEENPSEVFRLKMEQTTCFIGDGPYVTESP